MAGGGGADGRAVPRSTVAAADARAATKAGPECARASPSPLGAARARRDREGCAARGVHKH
eukprot:3160524-Prymnesium_polylepis.1